MGAGLQQNKGRAWGPTTWEEMTGSQPSETFTNVAESSAKQVESQRKRKATDKAKTKRRQSKYSRTDDSVAARQAYSRHDNGIEPEDVCDDVSPEHLTELKNTFYNSKVVVTKEEAEDIERDTRAQNESEYWMTERRKRLTASRVGSVAKMKRTTKRSSKVQQYV